MFVERIEEKIIQTYGAVTEIMGAILLINDHRAPGLDHHQIFKMQIRDLQRGGAGGPRLNPNPILRSNKSAVRHVDSRHVQLRRVSAQAANADAVPRPAGDVADAHLRHPAAHGDAVVAGLYGGAGHAHLRRVRQVEAVGVGAVGGGRHGEPVERHVVACQAVCMVILAVFGGHVLDSRVSHEIEAQALIKLK